jgi:DNA-binding XRE family transcriptional regulator
MSTARLPNHIRKYRKRAFLTQSEVAFILELKSSAGVSRHENFKQTPDLQSLLAYEMLFRTPVRNLFSGTRHKVEQKLLQRIRLLITRLRETVGRRRGVERKIEILSAYLEERQHAATFIGSLQGT